MADALLLENGLDRLQLETSTVDVVSLNDGLCRRSYAIGRTDATDITVASGQTIIRCVLDTSTHTDPAITLEVGIEKVGGGWLVKGTRPGEATPPATATVTRDNAGQSQVADQVQAGDTLRGYILVSGAAQVCALTIEAS